MDERTWLNRVIALAEQFGWRCWHIAAPMRAARGGGFVGDARASGLPDLVMIHSDPPRLIFAELKGDGGKLSDKQQQFLQAAQTVVDNEIVRSCEGENYLMEFPAPLGVYAWWPKDGPQVEQILRSRVLL